MNDTLFAVLDRMVEAGGQKLAKGVLVGELAKKAADGLLAELASHKYIRKDASGAVTWESGANRTATVPASGLITLNDTWRS